MPSRVSVSLFYLCFYGALGSLGPFLYLSYRRHGLSAPQIGIVIAVAHVMNLISAPIWGALNDTPSVRCRIPLLSVACLGAGPSILVLQAAHGFFPTIAAVILWGFFAGPIISLADAATLAILKGDRHTFGRVRVWGSVGTVAASLLIGIVGEQVGISIMFPVYVGLLILCVGLALLLPRTGNPRHTKPTGGTLHRLVGSGFFVFLCAILLLDTANMMWRTTYALHLDDLGLGVGLIGGFFALSSLVEIPLVALSREWLGRHGAGRAMVTAFSTYVLLWLGWSMVQSGPVVLALAIIHGFSFAVLQVAAVVRINELVPATHLGLALGLYAASSRGVGSVLGSLSGGALYDNVGGSSLYILSALLGLIAIGILTRLPRIQRGAV